MRQLQLSGVPGWLISGINQSGHSSAHRARIGSIGRFFPLLSGWLGRKVNPTLGCMNGSTDPFERRRRFSFSEHPGGFLHFSVIHSGQGDGWDVNPSSMSSVIT